MFLHVSVILSTGGGVCSWGGVCSRGGACSWRVSAPGGCLRWGCLLRGGGGVSAPCFYYIVQCVHCQTSPGGGLVSQHALRQTPPGRDGYCCGRYASYWNAVWLYLIWQVISFCRWKRHWKERRWGCWKESGRTCWSKQKRWKERWWSYRREESSQEGLDATPAKTGVASVALFIVVTLTKMCSLPSSFLNVRHFRVHCSQSFPVIVTSWIELNLFQERILTKLPDSTISWKLSIAIKIHEQVDVFDITIKLNACILISISTCLWLKILIEREKTKNVRPCYKMKWCRLRCIIY